MPFLNPFARTRAGAFFRRSLPLLLIPLAGCGGNSPAVITSGPRYIITDVSDGRASDAVALNDQGQVAVTSESDDIINAFLTRSISRRVFASMPLAYPASPAFARGALQTSRTAQAPPPITLLYQNGKYTDLTPQIPRGLNDRGQIAGMGSIWQNGQITPLPALDTRVSFSGVYAQALNNAGQIVGAAVVVPPNLIDPNSIGDVQHAFVYANGQMTDLGTLKEPPAGSDVGPNNSVALAINDTEQIVGASDTAIGTADGYFLTRHAFVWQNGKMTDLGTLGGFTSVATAINNNNQICGYAENAGRQVRATLWQNGQAQDLQISDLDSRARSINDAGQIVGGMVVGVFNEAAISHAFVIAGSHVYDLNKQVVNGNGWTLSNAVAINNQGQICGTGTYKGKSRAFLLTPQVQEGQ